MLFSKDLSLEFDGKIDCLAACPSMVETPILIEKCSNPETYKKAKPMMITPT